MSGDKISVFRERSGSLDSLFDGLASLRGAMLVFEDEDQVAASLDKQRIQFHGSADEGLWLVRAALRGEPGAHVAHCCGDGRRRRAES